jgi:hypothetical protein
VEYDERLINEWRRHFTPMTEPDPEQSENDRRRDARDRFERLDRSELPRIRMHVASSYVANGSLHILADDRRIGWHPDWVQHLRALLGDADIDASAGAA